MTEEEAKKKWCPHSLINAEQITHDSVSITQVNGGRCIASQCMAWRWQTDGLVLAFDVTEPIFRRPNSEPLHGYCGLAGKP